MHLMLKRQQEGRGPESQLLVQGAWQGRERNEELKESFDFRVFSKDGTEADGNIKKGERTADKTRSLNPGQRGSVG